MVRDSEDREILGQSGKTVDSRTLYFFFANAVSPLLNRSSYEHCLRAEPDFQFFAVSVFW